MTWEPRASEPEASLEAPVIDSLMTIVERDFAGALQYYFSTQLYDDFKQRVLGQVTSEIFPAFSVGPRENATDDSDDGSRLQEALQIECFIGVTAPTAALVTRKSMDYAKVFNSVVRSARRELVENLNNPIFVSLAIEHTYDSIRENKSIYFRGVGIELTLFLHER